MEPVTVLQSSFQLLSLISTLVPYIPILYRVTMAHPYAGFSETPILKLINPRNTELGWMNPKELLPGAETPSLGINWGSQGPSETIANALGKLDMLDGADVRYVMVVPPPLLWLLQNML